MQLLEDQDSADEEFWNQDFFADEAKDQEFEASESEQEDVADSDFSGSVSHYTAKSELIDVAKILNLFSNLSNMRFGVMPSISEHRIPRHLKAAQGTFAMSYSLEKKGIIVHANELRCPV